MGYGPTIVEILCEDRAVDPVLDHRIALQEVL
jgi:hypothetical protein